MKILTTSIRDAPQLNQLTDFIANHRHVARVNIGGDATGAAQRNQVPDQSVAGDIRGGADKATLGKFSASDVDVRHQGDYFFLKGARSDSTFNRGGGDAGPEWFREANQVAGTRMCIRRSI